METHEWYTVTQPPSSAGVLKLIAEARAAERLGQLFVELELSNGSETGIRTVFQLNNPDAEPRKDQSQNQLAYRGNASLTGPTLAVAGRMTLYVDATPESERPVRALLARQRPLRRHV